MPEGVPPAELSRAEPCRAESGFQDVRDSGWLDDWPTGRPAGWLVAPPPRLAAQKRLMSAQKRLMSAHERLMSTEQAFGEFPASV